MTLLIVGDPDDLTSAYVRFRAEANGRHVETLDESRFGLDWHFDLDEGDPAHATVELPGGRALPLRDVAGAFVRFTPTPEVPAALRGDPPLAEVYARERRAALHFLLSSLPAPVANSPGCGQANGSKPLQMAQLTAAGFDVPRWIASNDADAARRFVGTQPDGAIVKSCSGTRSEVRRCTDEFFDRLALGSPPVVVQQWIDGIDVRVHSVRDAVFGTAVEAGAGIDYRFDDARRRYFQTDVPAELARLCADFAARHGLLIAGFDFRVEKSGRWRCLECNPAPTFLPYEMETGQPIADAVIALFGT